MSVGKGQITALQMDDLRHGHPLPTNNLHDVILAIGKIGHANKDEGPRGRQMPDIGLCHAGRTVIVGFSEAVQLVA